MAEERYKNGAVLGLVVALVVILIGGVLFVGAVSGWFDDPKITLDREYYCEKNCDDLMNHEIISNDHDLLTNKQQAILANTKLANKLYKVWFNRDTNESFVDLPSVFATSWVFSKGSIMLFISTKLALT